MQTIKFTKSKNYTIIVLLESLVIPAYQLKVNLNLIQSIQIQLGSIGTSFGDRDGVFA